MTNHSFLSNKYYISQALCQPLETTKMNFEKLLANCLLFYLLCYLNLLLIFAR